MRITISGTAGSGKSTVARLVAKELGYRHYSMGDLQREIAKEKGLSIVELGELEKTDPSIDRMIDDRQKALSEKDDFVIDSWLGSFFISNTFRVFLDADIDERAIRITKEREAESYSEAKHAKAAILKRELDNKHRWQEFYGFTWGKKDNYDFFIDTTSISAQQVAKKIIDAVKAFSE